MFHFGCSILLVKTRVFFLQVSYFCHSHIFEKRLDVGSGFIYHNLEKLVLGSRFLHVLVYENVLDRHSSIAFETKFTVSLFALWLLAESVPAW
jgi:hypothetical protein